MKILNVNKHNEKLKIDPIKISDLNSIKTIEFKKSDLKTFDIVKLHGNYYMTFLNNDIITYNKGNQNLEEIPSHAYNKGIFIRNDEIRYAHIFWMNIDGYTDELKKTNKNYAWDIVEFYSCAGTDIFNFWNTKPFNIGDLTQNKFRELISYYEYKQIT